MVTDVRQRVIRQRYGRRGRKSDAAWAHRHLLLTAGDRLSTRQLARLGRVFAEADPTEEIAAAWACKELLRQLLAERDPTASGIGCGGSTTPAPASRSPRLSASPPPSRPGGQPSKVFLELGVTNARTEGLNRIIKQTKRVGCGFRNIDNYQRRILAHIAVTRQRPAAA